MPGVIISWRITLIYPTATLETMAFLFFFPSFYVSLSLCVSFLPHLSFVSSYPHLIGSESPVVENVPVSESAFAFKLIGYLFKSHHCQGAQGTF